MARALEVLFVDNHLLVVAKPAGVAAVPDDSGDESLYDTAKEWVRREFEKPGDAFLGIVHRLDRPVSGVMVFARTTKGASRLSEQFRSRLAHKSYWGVGEGNVLAEAGALSQWLEKDERTNRVRVLDHPGRQAKQAITRWRVIERRPGRTLFEFTPETGRPHQLRVAAATLGTPLLGDLKYGASAPLADKSIALHAFALELAHPTRAERLRFTTRAPKLPEWEFDATK
ncbi:MAG: RluA family pseudouridine synthase [Planctomycetes bacterium]|nr:RluA family pseudouridine synthase [Planctomycetota bacterium]